MAPAYAQVTSGAVSGTVVDSTGAVIPGATVTLTGEGTGVTREQQTNAAGGFLFDRVRNGSYTLTITMQGFRTFRSTGVEVSVGKVSALGSLALEVGSQVETVEVEVGALPLMQAESPEIVGRYEARKVADLTWGTFGLDAIAFLTPGVVPSFGNINTNTTGFGSQIGGDTGAVPAAAGQRGRSTQFNMDGHEINDITIGGPSIFLDNLDTVAEYQVSTTQFDASQGRLPGAQVNVTTKSGTNEVHGSVFYFYQANSLRAKESVESRFDLEKPKTIKQTYGFTAGGPIIKNKWFGFGSYERFKIPGGEAETSSGTFALTSAGATNLAGAFPGNNAVGLYASRGPFSISDGNPTCASAPVMIDFSSAGGPSAVEACEVARTVPDSETL
ncbi:MAG: carboxypeptidase regulatory-like domain-containing protein, partial [Terriglobia bacterium]